MSTTEKWDVLFITDDKSNFDSNTEVLDNLFHRVDKVQGKEDSLRRFSNNLYDMVICDMSVNPEDVSLVEAFQEKKPKQTIFAFVEEKDTPKAYKLTLTGVNAFILSPDQFDEALAEIARFDPYAKQ